MTSTNDGLRQASVRAVTSTALDYNSDFMALFDAAGIAAGNFDERLLAWINVKLAASYTSLPQAQQALAAANSVFNWSSMGTFDATTSSAISAPFAAVNSNVSGPANPVIGTANYEGWSVNYASQPTISSPVPFTVTKPGYSAADSLSANTVSAANIDTLNYVTTTLRNPFPNQASQSALAAALAEYVYINDIVYGGATNGSTIVCPKPIARHALPSRRVVGNSLHYEVVCAHRDARQGKQVAAVVVTVTDGSHTLTQTKVTPQILGYTGDQGSVVGYAFDFDTTTLTDQASFTLDVVVYPWFGASTASQRRTVDGTAANYWEFSTQTYYKHTAKVANPPLVYVSGTGTDAVVDVNGASGGLTKVSTNATTASTNAFATLASAISALKAATNVTGGFTDGCQVRISNTTVAWPSSTLTTGTYQTAGELIITRDPLFLQSACIFSYGVANTNLRQQWLRVQDLTVNRAGGANQIILNSPGQLIHENCAYDNTSRTSQVVGSATITMSYINTTISNGAGGAFSGGTTPYGIMRGLVGSTLAAEMCCTIGCKFLTNGSVTPAAARDNNCIAASNHFLSQSASPITISSTADGIGLLNNNFEWIGTTAVNATTFAISADGALNNTNHVVIHGNTCSGASAAGRWNIAYNETNNTPRTQTLWSIKGNISVQEYIKSDNFHGINGGNVEGFTVGSPSTFTGNWAPHFGTGCNGNFSNYSTANPTTEAAEYAGLNCIVGSNTNTPQVAFASLWINPQCSTWNGTTYTAGAGGGDYRLVTANLGLIAKLPDPVLSHTIDGVARQAANDYCGAFSAA